MITPIRPDEQPEQPDWKPRVKLEHDLQETVGWYGLQEMISMFDNPYQSYPEPLKRARWKAVQFIDTYRCMFDYGLIGLAASQDGYQLTADGRYYVRLHLEAKAAEQERAIREEQRWLKQWEHEKREYYAHSHMDVW